jgi:tRNA (guanine-N7-)-methyltransferase
VIQSFTQEIRVGPEVANRFHQPLTCSKDLGGRDVSIAAVAVLRVDPRQEEGPVTGSGEKGSAQSPIASADAERAAQERAAQGCDSTHNDDDRTPGDLRSFGRRRGRKATAHQRKLLDDLLPRLALDPQTLAGGGVHDAATLATLCGASESQVWLEIGFGGGEHLIWQAGHNPHVAMIGSEPFEDGVVKVLAAIEAGRLNHVRLVPDDVRPLLRALPQASLSRVFILFPDPWPKRRHRKRRLIGPAFLAELARVMRPGGQLRFATDIGDYARTALLALDANASFEWIAQRPADWRERPADWPATRYEEKAVREGRRRYYFQFCRR